MLREVEVHLAMTTASKAPAGALLAQHNAALDHLIQQCPQLRATQLRLFLSIAEQEGRSMSELARELGLTLAAVSRNCDIFSGRGRKDGMGPRLNWIRMVEDESNRSVRLVYLTKQGLEAVTKYIAILHGEV